MFHEIGPKKYHVAYKNCLPEPDDTVFLFNEENLYCRIVNGLIEFPGIAEIGETGGMTFRYLFSVEEERFFMPDVFAANAVLKPEGYELKDIGFFRTAKPRHLAFAAVTALDIYIWYMKNRFCGLCGSKTAHSQTERACICTNCASIIYPRISPVVIVAVTNGDYLLATKYKDRVLNRYALVAGFVEIGESLEDAVRREAFEETGVRVRNIRYYKSQPWSFTSTILSGFYCDLDGDPDIRIDENELAEAVWLHRGEIQPSDFDIALTAEMMEMFRTGAIK